MMIDRGSEKVVVVVDEPRRRQQQQLWPVGDGELNRVAVVAVVVAVVVVVAMHGTDGRDLNRGLDRRTSPVMLLLPQAYEKVGLTTWTLLMNPIPIGKRKSVDLFLKFKIQKIKLSVH
jgi:hypothetical protein